ncbi:UDP-2,3-diacylglucosamine diphosphatase [Endozoicomonas sp. OPT23]|uniref:UDP-2,3-diacylglucosamine diphosphatase n=1 Tax=Endozoicomonas sp. OPT23 TaxID=2072845 RepID=UPI00129AEDA2|nr:UDP-2,3-diacylglucosamine diphosphatase [Endozoicomonas sp. OPT23]MRI34811.1 UDP-2,3-diacylglucosamine diphosphatase [Endozoicomonas sp. OPT23]
MTAAFISDLHLTPERPDIFRAFVSYMEHQALKVNDLYILGDFFEYWLGDDAMEAFHHNVASLLKQYTDSGRNIYLMPGNRDFAIGKQFLKQTGAIWLKDPCTIKLNGEKVLLMHGDLLCTEDKQYLKYRKIIRSPLVMFLLRMTPLSYRKNLGRKIRENSRKAKTGKSLEIMDVTSESVSDFMIRYGVKTLVHGHTHRPNIHDVDLPDDKGQRIVLGDWDKLGWELIEAEGGLKLLSFPITDA